MEIKLSQYAGFCEGVDRAFAIVKNIAKDPLIKKPIYVLGSLVHNKDVVKHIEDLGVKKINITTSLENLLDEIKGKVGTLVITAHGMGPKIYQLAREKNIDLVDTTCPRVIKVQRLAKIFFDRMSQIVIIGEKEHKEVKGIYEWAQKRAVFVENEQELQNLVLDPNKKIAILSQTTQNQDFVEYASKYIAKKYRQVEIIDSICLTTHHRQDEIKKMAAENEVIIVIGSKESANSTRLWEIAREMNKKSYFIENAAELDEGWIGKSKKIGVSAGASTPSWVIDEVILKLKEISG